MPENKYPPNNFAARFARENPTDDILLGEELADEASEITARLMRDIRDRGGDFGIAAETEWKIRNLPPLNSNAEFKETVIKWLGAYSRIANEPEKMGRLAKDIDNWTKDFNSEDWFLFCLHYMKAYTKEGVLTPLFGDFTGKLAPLSWRDNIPEVKTLVCSVEEYPDVYLTMTQGIRKLAREFSVQARLPTRADFGSRHLHMHDEIDGVRLQDPDSQHFNKMGLWLTALRLRAIHDAAVFMHGPGGEKYKDRYCAAGTARACALRTAFSNRHEIRRFPLPDFEPHPVLDMLVTGIVPLWLTVSGMAEKLIEVSGTVRPKIGKRFAIEDESGNFPHVTNVLHGLNLVDNCLVWPIGYMRTYAGQIFTELGLPNDNNQADTFDIVKNYFTKRWIFKQRAQEIIWPEGTNQELVKSIKFSGLVDVHLISDLKSGPSGYLNGIGIDASSLEGRAAQYRNRMVSSKVLTAALGGDFTGS